MTEPEQDKLNNLSQRIDAAKRENESAVEAMEFVSPEEQGRGRNVGYDLLATVLGSMLVGWLIDKMFATSPWGLIGMIPVGFIVAMFQVWQALGKNDKNVKTKD